MSDEYNLTWEQADAAMKLGAVVKTKGYLPLRFKDDGYEFLDDEVWRNLPTWAGLGKLMYKIHSIPRCEESYRKVSMCSGEKTIVCDMCSTHAGDIDFVKRKCEEKLMARIAYNDFLEDLHQEKKEEPKMSEKLMSFDEAVVWMVRNPNEVLYFISKDKDGLKMHYSRNFSCGTFNLEWKEGSVKHLESVDINEYIDSRFSKTPIKIEQKVNGLGLKNDSEFIGFAEGYNTSEDKLIKALQTYIKLLKHPFVVKSKPLYQYVITSSHNYDFELSTEDYSSNNSKVDHLSPVFSSKEDAEKAISDIGQDKLLFMFKTLKGL